MQDMPLTFMRASVSGPPGRRRDGHYKKVSVVQVNSSGGFFVFSGGSVHLSPASARSLPDTGADGWFRRRWAGRFSRSHFSRTIRVLPSSITQGRVNSRKAEALSIIVDFQG
jgi:hypothetical protein